MLKITQVRQFCLFYKKMEYVLLSNTNCMVSRTALSATSLKDSKTEDVVALLRKAYEGGINFYHTSEDNAVLKSSLGYAFYGMRKEVFISVSSSSKDTIEVQNQIIETLDALNSSYIDIFSIHKDDFVPKKHTNDGLYLALLSAKADDNIKSIGFSTSNLELAKEALDSKLYDVIILQYALGKTPTETEIQFFEECKKQETGLIINYEKLVSEEIEYPLIFGFLRKFENLISMWKIKNQEDLQQVFYFEANPPQITENVIEEINRVKAQRLENL